MIELKCGCNITQEGKFEVGEKCKTNQCRECLTISELHPFGEGRL